MGSSSDVSGRAPFGRQGCLRSLVLRHAKPKRAPIVLVHPHAESDSVGLTFVQRIAYGDRFAFDECVIIAVSEPVADVDHELHAHADAHAVGVAYTLTDSDTLGY